MTLTLSSGPNSPTGHQSFWARVFQSSEKRTSDEIAVEPHNNRCTEESAEGYYNVTQKLYEPNPKNLKSRIQLVSRHEFFKNFLEYYNGKAVNRLNLNLDNSQHLEYDY
jgi:hypothetical protein